MHIVCIWHQSAKQIIPKMLFFYCIYIRILHLLLLQFFFGPIKSTQHIVFIYTLCTLFGFVSSFTMLIQLLLCRKLCAVFDSFIHSFTWLCRKMFMHSPITFVGLDLLLVSYFGCPFSSSIQTVSCGVFFYSIE